MASCVVMVRILDIFKCKMTFTFCKLPSGIDTIKDLITRIDLAFVLYDRYLLQSNKTFVSYRSNNNSGCDPAKICRSIVSSVLSLLV